ncbi:hypothetical protein BDR06DRAFT_773047 [Suillus hirtellus]|nr:hypothetical protein BDR06DRAFT_773047 [Suillus hirtellus]
MLVRCHGSLHICRLTGTLVGAHRRTRTKHVDARGELASIACQCSLGDWNVHVSFVLMQVSSLETQVDLSVWTAEIVEHRSRSDKVLIGLVALLEACLFQSPNYILVCNHGYLPLLDHCVQMSWHYRHRRWSNILPHNTKRCLQGDEASLDLPLTSAFGGLFLN